MTTKQFMSKTTALSVFNTEVKPYLTHTDATALRTAWNDFTDALCKSGEISERAYNDWLNPFP